jgi:hypothetical protein
LIIEGLKKRLYDKNSKKGGKWIHELPHVVWGLRTQPSKATGQTPFFLVYGSEAILPADIMWKSPRVEMYIEGEADEATLLKRLAALLLFSQPDTCRGSGDTMIAT